MPEIRSQTLSRHLADASAHHLHRGHQRPGEKRSPQQFGSELRAGNGISRNARWVVVGSPGDDPRPERLQQRSNPARWGSRRQKKVEVPLLPWDWGVTRLNLVSVPAPGRRKR